MGVSLLGYVVYMRLDTVLQEWVDALEIWQIYLGMYVLILAAVVVIVAPLLSCFAVYQEIVQLLMVVSTKPSKTYRAPAPLRFVGVRARSSFASITPVTDKRRDFGNLNIETFRALSPWSGRHRELADAYLRAVRLCVILERFVFLVAA